MLTLNLPTQQYTEQIAQAIAPHLGAGDVVALWGDLGAGKSTLCRAIIQTLCGAETVVPSPTFTLIQTYDTPKNFAIWHMDMYRLTDPDESYELGLQDAFGTACCLIEWGDKLHHHLPKNRIDITLKNDTNGNENARIITIKTPNSNHPLNTITL